MGRFVIQQFLLVFHFAFQIIDAVFPMVKPVVDGRRHFPAGFIAAAGTVHLTGVFRIFPHGHENLFQIFFQRYADGAGFGPVRIMPQVIFQTQFFKLPVQLVHPLFRRKTPGPGAVRIVFLYAFANLQQVIVGFIRYGNFRIDCGAADTSLFTVQGVDHQERRLTAGDQFCVPVQIMVHPFFAAHFPDKGIFANQPFYVFHQAARGRVEGTEAVFDFIGDRLAADPVLADIGHQVFKGDVIGNDAVGFRIVYLQLLCNTGADESQLVRHAHFVPRINGRAHERTLYGEEFRNQFGMIFFDIRYNRRAGLGDAACKPILPYVIDVTPGGDIGAERNIDKAVDAQLSQSAQHRFIFFRIVGFKSGGNQDRDLFASGKIVKETLRVVVPCPRVVIAGIETCAAGNAAVRVHIDA